MFLSWSEPLFIRTLTRWVFPAVTYQLFFRCGLRQTFSVANASIPDPVFRRKTTYPSRNSAENMSRPLNWSTWAIRSIRWLSWWSIFISPRWWANQKTKGISQECSQFECNFPGCDSFPSIWGLKISTRSENPITWSGLEVARKSDDKSQPLPLRMKTWVDQCQCCTWRRHYESRRQDPLPLWRPEKIAEICAINNCLNTHAHIHGFPLLNTTKELIIPEYKATFSQLYSVKLTLSQLCFI